MKINNENWHFLRISILEVYYGIFNTKNLYPLNRKVSSELIVIKRRPDYFIGEKGALAEVFLEITL